MDREDKQYVQDRIKKDYTKMKISLYLRERNKLQKQRESESFLVMKLVETEDYEGTPKIRYQCYVLTMLFYAQQ